MAIRIEKDFDLLDVSRITQGKIELKIGNVDVAAVVSLAVEMNRQLVDKHSYKLTVNVPPAPLFVRGDHSRIAQVLSNLVNNALKYTEPGGRISVNVEAADSEVVFRVRDSGIGIPKNMLHSIFELFTQAERSLDRSQGGLGIGLTIVQRLVSMQGGTVEAFSDGPQKGSEFVVRLPRVNMRVRAKTEANAARDNDIPQRVLVVDDYADAAESMAALLRLHGHEVRIAHDGAAAIDAAREFKPDVVFLDIGLPRMDGYQVVHVLRTMPETRDCHFIAISGYGRTDDHRRSREAGFCRHLVKPVDLLAIGEVFDGKTGQHCTCLYSCAIVAAWR